MSLEFRSHVAVETIEGLGYDELVNVAVETTDLAVLNAAWRRATKLVTGEAAAKLVAVAVQRAAENRGRL